MDERAIGLLERSRVATLATLAGDGSPHLVPVVFAVEGPDLVTAIDGKPKKGTRLARLENVARDPRVTILVHHYEEDWSRLWWVRIDGRASLEETGDGFNRALTALAQRYPQYASVELGGPVIRIRIEGTTAWEASSA